MGGSRAAAVLLVLNIVFFTMVSSTTLPAASAGRIHSPKGKYCSIGKLSVCANLLGQLKLVNLGLGIATSPPKSHPCCPLIHGLVDLSAAACLCTAIKADVLGIKLDVPLSLTLLLNYCHEKLPSGFKCK